MWIPQIFKSFPKEKHLSAFLKTAEYARKSMPNSGIQDREQLLTVYKFPHGLAFQPFTDQFVQRNIGRGIKA